MGTTSRTVDGASKMLTIETDAIGHIVLIGKAKTGIRYTNQVNGVVCSRPEVEGFVALVLNYEPDDNGPEVFQPGGTEWLGQANRYVPVTDKPLPNDYKKQIELAVKLDFEHYIEDFEVTGKPAPQGGQWDLDHQDVEAWVHVRFRLKGRYGQEPSDWIEGVLTWPNSD